MTKQCELTGIKVSIGNNVSHAHNKTKRNFMPNLQRKNIYSDILNQMVRLKISTKAIKKKIIKPPEIKKKISEKK